MGNYAVHYHWSDLCWNSCEASENFAGPEKSIWPARSSGYMGLVLDLLPSHDFQNVAGGHSSINMLTLRNDAKIIVRIRVSDQNGVCSNLRLAISIHLCSGENCRCMGIKFHTTVI